MVQVESELSSELRMEGKHSGSAHPLFLRCVSLKREACWIMFNTHFSHLFIQTLIHLWISTSWTWRGEWRGAERGDVHQDDGCWPAGWKRNRGTAQSRVESKLHGFHKYMREHQSFSMYKWLKSNRLLEKLGNSKQRYLYLRSVMRISLPCFKARIIHQYHLLSGCLYITNY